MKKGIFLGLAILILLGSAYGGKPEKFDPEKFKDLKKTTKKMVDDNLKNLSKHGVTQIVIIECVGEFLTSKETEASAFEKRHSSWTWKTKSTIELGSDYYETVTNYVYELTKELFEENGIKVVEREVLVNNPDYQEIGLKEEKKQRGYTGGVAKKSVTTESVKRSATGMGFVSGVFGAIGQTVKLSQLIPKIVVDTGSDATVKVNFYVGKAKKGAPILSSYNIALDSNLKTAKAGKGKVSYYFQSAGVGILAMKNAIESTVDISGADKGSVDLEKYHSALTNILQAVKNMYSFAIKSELGG